LHPTNAPSARYATAMVYDQAHHVVVLYGGADTGIPAETIEQMRRALASAPAPGSESQFVVYPDASHAFFADYRPSYHERSAQDGWARCQDWFKKYGLS